MADSERKQEIDIILKKIDGKYFKNLTVLGQQLRNYSNSPWTFLSGNKMISETKQANPKCCFKKWLTSMSKLNYLCHLKWPKVKLTVVLKFNAVRLSAILSETNIFGVNSDADILADKGPTVFNIDERMKVLYSSEWVSECIPDTVIFQIRNCLNS